MHCSIMLAAAQGFSGEAASVALPGAEGILEVADNHAGTVVLLKAGRVIITAANGEGHSYLVSGGVASVGGDEVIVLADRCESNDAQGLANILQELDGLRKEYEASEDGPRKEQLFNRVDALSGLQ